MRGCRYLSQVVGLKIEKQLISLCWLSAAAVDRVRYLCCADGTPSRFELPAPSQFLLTMPGFRSAHKIYTSASKAPGNGCPRVVSDEFQLAHQIGLSGWMKQMLVPSAVTSAETYLWFSFSSIFLWFFKHYFHFFLLQTFELEAASGESRRLDLQEGGRNTFIPWSSLPLAKI